MSNITFEKTLTDIIKDYLTNGLPRGYFKIIYYGDPINIPSSLLPCITVDELGEKIESGPTGMDRIETKIRISLMYNKKEDFGKTTDELVGKRKLEEFAKAIDKNTHEYSPLSVMGILRKHFTLGDVVLNQDIDINFGVVPRNEITAEAQITVTFRQLRVVSGRD